MSGWTTPTRPHSASSERVAACWRRHSTCRAPGEWPNVQIRRARDFEYGRRVSTAARPGARHTAGGQIDHTQRVQELAGATPAAVGDQVYLEEPGPRIRPVGERPNGDLAFEQRAGFGGADAAPRFSLLA